jgi:hypothetical protein
VYPSSDPWFVTAEQLVQGATITCTNTGEELGIAARVDRPCGAAHGPRHISLCRRVARTVQVYPDLPILSRLTNQTGLSMTQDKEGLVKEPTRLTKRGVR